MTRTSGPMPGRGAGIFRRHHDLYREDLKGVFDGRERIKADGSAIIANGNLMFTVA
ncbi:hypothetical protein ACN2XU_09605 [Primorskyibacter sp. 2E107]|uniref:hypothetical protein n=1 Tax=Primorskyibacter sp. 2E107 TaxID=3403458 RepID=UPI003AF86740